MKVNNFPDNEAAMMEQFRIAIELHVKSCANTYRQIMKKTKEILLNHASQERDKEQLRILFNFIDTVDMPMVEKYLTLLATLGFNTSQKCQDAGLLDLDWKGEIFNKVCDNSAHDILPMYNELMKVLQLHSEQTTNFMKVFNIGIETNFYIGNINSRDTINIVA